MCLLKDSLLECQKLLFFSYDACVFWCFFLSFAEKEDAFLVVSYLKLVSFFMKSS